jgi:hypothetical protein
MWPTQFVSAVAPDRWSERSLRSRSLAILGIVALLVVASIGTWLSIRGGQPATPTLYGTGRSEPGAVWSWDGARYMQAPAPGAGPSSNDADMAYDRARGVVVLWDHGCANLVMGFQGGCIDQVNRTWTWDGHSWAARSTDANPTAAGRGTMLFDSRVGRVVYVNGLGQTWTWTGAEWSSLAMRGSPRVERNLGGALTTFAAGYDEARGALVFVLATGTWSWDGTRWTADGGGIEAGEARADAHLGYDRAHGRLVYVGSRYTWTWDGDRWNPHDQPAIAGGTLAYDPTRRSVMLVEQDSSACDRTACWTATWRWDSTAWTRLPAAAEAPLFPLTRSGAYAAPMASDDALGVALLFVSAS